MKTPLFIAAQQDTVFRGADGRTTGTAATSGNMTTFRDGWGRTAGTATHKVRTGPF
jgi:hypothetical protein